MARAKTPSQLRLIQGTHRNDRHGRKKAAPAAPAAKPGDLEPPDWLSPGAAAHFTETAARLAPLRILSAADLDALAHYCAVWDQIKAAPHRANGAMHATARNLRNDLGMSPNGRQRITSAGESPKINPFEALKQ